MSVGSLGLLGAAARLERSRGVPVALIDSGRALWARLADRIQDVADHGGLAGLIAERLVGRRPPAAAKQQRLALITIPGQTKPAPGRPTACEGEISTRTGVSPRRNMLYSRTLSPLRSLLGTCKSARRRDQAIRPLSRRLSAAHAVALEAPARDVRGRLRPLCPIRSLSRQDAPASGSCTSTEGYPAPAPPPRAPP